MRAVVHRRYGRPMEALEVAEVDRPEPSDDQVLVRVEASSVNPAEWYAVTGPYFARPSYGWLRPKRPLIGGDLAGTIEAVGKNVSGLQPGDEVFGTSGASWAQYAPARGIRLARKPTNVSFADAAAAPVAAITALQALRDHGNVERGQRVLINGASGGVGTYAVQLAKHFGAEVGAVCSPRNVERAEELGAQRVTDYTRDDFTRSSERYDLLLDIAGRTPLSRMRRVLAPGATVVLVGGKMTFRGLGPLPHTAATIMAGKLRRQKVKVFIAKINDADLGFLAGLLANGELRSVIDREYPLEETPHALAYLGEGHARGKIVISVP